MSPAAASGIWRAPAAGGSPEVVYAAPPDPLQCLILAGWSGDGAALLFWRQPQCSASLAADGVSLYSIRPGDGEPRPVMDSMLLHPDFLRPAAAGRLAAVRGSGRITWAGKGVVVADASSGGLTA